MSTFNRPYFNEKSFYLQMALVCGAFMIVFLAVFMPFGVNEPKKTFNLEFVAALLSFGVTITSAMALNEWILRKLIIPNPSKRKVMAWLFWLCLTAGSANFIVYNAWQSFYDWHFSSYLQHIFGTTAVLIFPIAGLIYFEERKYLNQKIELLDNKIPEQSIVTLHFSDETDKDVIQLLPDQYLFLEADDNYVKVYYYDHGSSKTHLLRATLKSFESDEALKNYSFRIHRKYLVNPYMIEKLIGNSQKMDIKIRYIPTPLPVSRRLIPDLRKRLKEI